MKILIVCSKQFYSKIDGIKKVLEDKGNEISLPNTYGAPETEQQMWDQGKKA